MTLCLRLHGCLVLVAALTAYAAQAQAQTQSQVAYKAGKVHISAQFKADRRACARLVGNAREVCFEEAKAQKKTTQARLEFGSTGIPAVEYRVSQAIAEADYVVARQRCMAQAGNARHVCIKQAKAIETHAMVDARSTRKIIEIQQDAKQKKGDALYAVATKKCDALAAEGRHLCIAAAKAQFGKS